MLRYHGLFNGLDVQGELAEIVMALDAPRLPAVEVCANGVVENLAVIVEISPVMRQLL
jgi:hypothetical protein